MANISKMVDYFQDRNRTHDSVHTAVATREVIDSQQGLHYRCMGNTRTFCWPDRATCPQITMVAIGTWTSFLIGDESGSATDNARLQIPWRVSENRTRVIAIPRIVVPGSTVRIRFRLRSVTLISTVATVNGASSATLSAGDPTFRMTSWHKGYLADQYQPVAYTGQTLVEPTLAADRWVALEPQVYIDTSDYSAISDLSMSVVMRLASISIMDLPDDVVGA